jgi:predicted MPP superfamily phosphohydrolase
MHIPLIGLPFTLVNDKRHAAGLNAFGTRRIYTTRGVGSLYGLRLNGRPEVTWLI